MIITQTPLRVSLAGGGTDFKDFYEQEEGFVVSIAINKYVFVIVRKRFDDRIVIGYMKKEVVNHVDEIQHELVREAMKMTGVQKGIEINIMADVPSEGTGLGSSSSLTVGLLNALYTFQGKSIPAWQLAQEACEIEIEQCNKPIGKQDQYIAAYGNLQSFKFWKNGEVEVEKIRISEDKRRELESNLLLFFSGKTRESSLVLSEQKNNICDRISELRALRAYAREVRDCLWESEDVDRIGPILNDSWQVKQQLAENISNAKIYTMYQKALAAGAIGGKICGAGGGGFLLLYVKPEKQQVVRDTMKLYQELPFAIENSGSKVILNRT